jgi:hypothetical protein
MGRTCRRSPDCMAFAIAGVHSATKRIVTTVVRDTETPHCEVP